MPEARAEHGAYGLTVGIGADRCRDPRRQKWTAGGAIALLTMLSVAAGDGRQGTGLVGYLPKDRVVELAAAADGSLASYTPSPAALASFVALVDPVHLRVFLCASRPADLAFAAPHRPESVEAGAPIPSSPPSSSASPRTSPSRPDFSPRTPSRRPPRSSSTGWALNSIENSQAGIYDPPGSGAAAEDEAGRPDLPGPMGRTQVDTHEGDDQTRQRFLRSGFTS